MVGCALNTKRVYTANDFFRARFDSKVIKIAVDGGFTCPNRDGTLSTAGCVFCSTRGSGDFAPSAQKSISEQFDEMKLKMSGKWKTGQYLIYFQAFTNTYAPVEILERLYNEALALDQVVGISIATRPDCIDADVYDLLAALNKKAYVSVELGLQTANEETAKQINRCFTNDVFADAVKKLQQHNIDCVSHIILGLPHETKQDMLRTVQYVSSLGISGVKLQLLHVLKNTPLAEQYRQGVFQTLSLEQYVDIVVSCIKMVPPHVVVHRLTGDGPKELLVAPRFLLDKKVVLNSIHAELIKRNIWQGDGLEELEPV